MARKGIPTVQIVFVDSDGTTTNGPRIVPQKPGRKLNHSEWDEAKAVQRFCWYLSRQDMVGVEAAVDALLRLNRLGKAFTDCERGRTPNETKVKTLLNLWNSHGLWRIPRELKDSLYLFIDAIRYFAPPYSGQGLTLYRGQSVSRHDNRVYGISWTSEYKIAVEFSRLRDTPGIVLRVDATPEMIAVYVPDYISAGRTKEEDEYLVDPRLIREISHCRLASVARNTEAALHRRVGCLSHPTNAIPGNAAGRM